MREISLAQIAKPKEDSLKEICSSLEKALVAALKQINPATINVAPAQNHIQVDNDAQSYLIEVKRDGHGRINTMVVRPYEPS